MRFKRTMRILAAGVLTACVLALTGGAGNNAAVVEAAGSGMNVLASISGKDVTVTASATSAPASDDGMLYLFAEPIWSDTISTNALASAPAAGNATFTTPLNANSADSRLYSKFIVAALQGGQYVPLNPGAYIVNPEAIADHTTARTNAGKKGLLIDPAKLSGNEMVDLGVKQAIYNIPLSNIIGPTTHASYPTVNYNYNGKTYQFNGLVVAESDNIFKTMSDRGICITAAILNNMGNYPQLIHPLSRDGSACPYYAFNNAEPEGVDYITAAASFLAERYSNQGHGKVDNWVIGNEVTARVEWNYINVSDLNAYVNEYAESYRLFYNGIKSRNANANVYICIDQQWDRNRAADAGKKYDSKDLIDAFNANIATGGNIDWGLACHPMPLPLTWAPYWTTGAYYKNLVKHNVNSAYVTMENIEVLTDYMCRPELLAPNGQVRSIIATEVGYTDSQGQDMQAAAFVHGYLQAENNQHIDAFILSRETDVAAEIGQGLAFGVTNVDGSPKLIYDYYKYIDTPNAGPYMDQAKAMMGISDWSQVLTAR